MVRLQHRAEQAADDRYGGERSRPVQVAFAGTQVTPDHDRRATEDHDDHHPQDRLAQPGSTGGDDSAIAILNAHRLGVERDRQLRKRGTRYAHRLGTRLTPDPCGHIVMRDERPMIGRSARERVEIQVASRNTSGQAVRRLVVVDSSRCERNRAIVPTDRA